MSTCVSSSDGSVTPMRGKSLTCRYTRIYLPVYDHGGSETLE